MYSFFESVCQAWFTLEGKCPQGWIGVCTKYRNLYKKHRVMDFVNDLDFSLYAVLVHLSAAGSQLQKEEQSSGDEF